MDKNESMESLAKEDYNCKSDVAAGECEHETKEVVENNNNKTATEESKPEVNQQLSKADIISTSPTPPNTAATPANNANDPSSTEPATQQKHQPMQQHTVTSPPKITLPPGQHQHSEPAPSIGPGWTQQLMQKRTPTGPYGKVERYYIPPDGGRKFRSMFEVYRYLGISPGTTAAASSGSSSIAKTTTNNASSGLAGGNNRVVSLKVETTTSTTSTNNNSLSSSAANSPRPPISSGPGTGRGIDTHPFSRSSVIEVLYVKRKKIVKEGEQRRIDNSSNNEDVVNNGRRTNNVVMMNWDDDESISDWFNSDTEEENDDSKNNNTDNVYLADIIQWVPLYPNLDNKHPSQKFKYYIHYRDFNRRMDEWITMDRIVSPPSIGNAKIRAIKRREERRKREEDERKERERILNEAALGLGGVMGSRRRTIEENSLISQGIVVGGVDAGTTSGGDTFVAGSGSLGVNTAAATIGRKRLRRTASTGVDVVDSSSSSVQPSNQTSSSSLGELNDTEQSITTQRRMRRGVGVGSGAIASSPTHHHKAVGSSGAIQQQVEHTAVDVVTTIAAQVLDEHEGMDAIALKEHEEVTKIKNVNILELGKYQMDTWYFSPLPREMFKDKDDVIDVLYVDEFSLNFFTRKEELLRYQNKTLNLSGGGDRGSSRRDRRHPPGNEIYRCGNLSMFEVDGFEERLYCQNLCYIAKLFLDHKTLYFDVDPFLFYVLCEVDERGYHPVGYYSKEKYSDVGYNLACILTFPSHQRKGYGRFLIAFSYELSKKEEKVGSPEKPMSDLGQQAYIPYWTSTIVDFLLTHSDNSKSMSIMDIAKKTSIMAEDIIFALNTLGILKFVNGVYFIYAERGHLEELAKQHPVKEPRVDPSKLHWTPYINDVKKDKYSIGSKRASIEADTSG